MFHIFTAQTHPLCSCRATVSRQVQCEGQVGIAKDHCVSGGINDLQAVEAANGLVSRSGVGPLRTKT